MQENKNEKVNEYERAPGFRPRLAIYHANAKGTGCAIKMELHPAHGMTDGSIFCTLAAQKTVGNRLGPNPTFPTFDWTDAITVKLAFDDLTKMQQVFRGECESINGDHGLWHRTAKGNTKITLRHIVDPVCGYAFDVCHVPSEISPRSKTCREAGGYAGCGDERQWKILLQPSEALGISEVISGSMYLVAFGVPEEFKVTVAD